MDILFYSAALRGMGKRLLRMAVSHIPRERIDHCRSPFELKVRLGQPLGGRGIAMLHTANRGELEAMIACRGLLADFRIILALPDNGDATMALAHVLKPRFLVFTDGDLPDASVVLGKMLLSLRLPERLTLER